MIFKYPSSSVSDFSAGDQEIGTITFRVKVITSDAVIPFRVEGDFVRDPDGQWRLKGFRLYLLNSTEPSSVPGLD